MPAGKPMYQISELQQIINEQISSKRYPVTPKELYEPITYMMGLGGKRMRPALLLIACNLFSDDISAAVDPAMAIEVFHNFTLLHDDIMDLAPLRRGNQTVHKKWNTNVAILSGDVMLVEAYKLLTSINPALLPDILTIFNRTAVEVCEGQQIDMDFEKQEHVSIEQYLEMIRLKTSVLLGASLKIGALLGGATSADAKLLYDFGVNMGLAFQLQDDILDVYGDPAKFGKQIGGDIISNKKTFLLIKARQLALGDDAASLQKWLTSSDLEAKVSAVTALFTKLGVRQLAEAEMERFAEQGFASLGQIGSVPETRKELLRSFANRLFVRES
ncbi:MAG TPA: polyprenyl synthetase family protein [Sphingobacteriaceae bacterium]